ncbi:MAG TPA: hypothetical protein VEU62_18995 [Bryobacterales bacterium]|nr:hypothetical protein [Bryobacterales bacterium]
MIALALLFTCLAGWLILGPWLRTRPQIGPVVTLCLSFAAGAAALSLQLLLCNLGHIPWNRATVIAPWAAACAAVLYRRRGSLRLAWPKWSRPAWSEWPALLGAALFAAIVLLAWVPYERLMPLNEWDAIMLWMFKGKAFYLDGSVAPYLRRAHEFLGNPAYPLLIPLYATFLYIWMGEAADQAAKLLSPCFFASLAAGFYYFVRRFGSRPVAAIFTAMLIGLYMVDLVAFHYAGYADTAVAASVLLGAGFLYAWFLEDDYADFALAVVFASLGAWTKNEGQFFLGGFGLLAAGRLLWKRAWGWRYWLTLVAVPGLAVVPWAVARSLYGVKRPGQLSGEIVQTNVTSYWPTVKALVEHAFAPSIFNIAFPLCLLAVLLHRRFGLGPRFLVLPLLVLWQLFGVTLVYVTGPINLQWMIGSSLDRVLSQIAPLALLSAALVFAAYYNVAEARVVASSAPAKKAPGKPGLAARKHRK